MRKVLAGSDGPCHRVQPSSAEKRSSRAGASGLDFADPMTKFMPFSRQVHFFRAKDRFSGPVVRTGRWPARGKGYLDLRAFLLRHIPIGLLKLRQIRRPRPLRPPPGRGREGRRAHPSWSPRDRPQDGLADGLSLKRRQRLNAHACSFTNDLPTGQHWLHDGCTERCNEEFGEMAGTFELYKDKAGEFRFRLKAGNGEIILVSEGYKQKASAENGIGSVRRNAPLDERYERKATSSGKPMFNLKASNGQVIGTSEAYSSEPAREASIASVKINAEGARLVDQVV